MRQINSGEIKQRRQLSKELVGPSLSAVRASRPRYLRLLSQNVVKSGLATARFETLNDCARRRRSGPTLTSAFEGVTLRIPKREKLGLQNRSNNISPRDDPNQFVLIRYRHPYDTIFF